MAETEIIMDNTMTTTLIEVPKNEPDFQEVYNGPWIEKRIEYKANDRKHHEIILFGSWDGFRQGEELERQENQIYFVTMKLPLGSWVYRFQIDNEDWETNNETAKTIKDGVEFNTITVREINDIEEEAEEEKNDDNKSKKQQRTQVIFDEASQKFVVGKKKRHGRPSMELDLGIDFDDDAGQPGDAYEVEEEQNIPQENNVDPFDVNANLNMDNMDFSTMNPQNTFDGSAPFGTADMGNEDGNSRNRNNNKNERKRWKKRKMMSEEQQRQEKEFARKVFVEQLRQQQVHEDELNRVKLIWKQER